ncbi:UDP-glucose 4-epimerase GalE [Elstera cyanobacteriorum]|uniref:UDP-glucose 4-epimerase n=1 Tax=Elstera cyanobacteriorum TaxID=2022747 RepID=A0A255XLW0_9PROT|nr:UDP-glucose 4-epimerase GalE [Elstera cyanobacteriorum]MCK6441380.1 UDP-glucose 4-epimerase GalE [Elstera cyanobacteriorum]OYQ17949.1 UDP-glucose 4-epimerase GalE [Elstera cyanobacteriorum]GFZ84957.1 UDP-glucose 4-epimerase GalE [Elstera cyanobacteriorum]
MSIPVLVTGGAGYIGSHTCKALAQAGYLPISYDNLSRGFRDAVRYGPLVVGDIADRATLDAALAEHKPIAILHFAAVAYVGESMADPVLYYRNNTAGALSLIEAALAAGIDKLVFSSTCATYGVPKTLPIDEDTPQQPINPYGRSKRMVEQMLQDIGAVSPLRSVALRYFNACGTDPDGEIGENHDPETHLLPLAINAALGLGPQLQVFGTDYPTPDGTCIRDYIHVTDLADAHLRALTYLENGGATTAINLGTGSGFSIREILTAVERVLGSPVPHQVSPRRPGDPPSLVALAEKARDVLGWEAKHSDIETIVRTAAAWARRQHNR